MREIERDYQLQPVEASRDVLRRAATKGEIEEGLRTGVASTRQRLQHLCDAALKGCGSYTEYAERLEVAGVVLVPVTQLGDTKLSGLSYVLEGVMMKGSDLGKGYSPMGLSKRGVSYEQGRDIAAVSRQREREEARRLVASDRDTAHGQAGERGAAGRDPGATGTGHGGTNGRDTADTRFGGGESAAAVRSNHEANRERGEGMPRGSDGSASLSGSTGQRRTEPGDESPRHGNSDGHHVIAARERIMALAGPAADRDKPTGRKASGRLPSARDRSYEAVQRQVAGIGCQRYEVLLVDDQGEVKQKRDWTEKQLLDSVPWLKRMNARGHDVLVRPGGSSLALLDGLTKADTVKLERSNVPYSAKIQIEENRFQIWLQLGSAAASGKVRDWISESLGLPRPDIAKFGALAGFVKNHARALEEPSRFVLAHKPARPAAEFVAKWERMLKEADQLVIAQDQGNSSSRTR